MSATNEPVTQPEAVEEPLAQESQSQVQVVCCDHQEFLIPRSIANMFGYMRSMLDEDDADDGDDSDIPNFPVPNVNGTEMSHIIEFCRHYKEEPFPKIKTPVKSNSIADHVPAWYSAFVQPFSEEELYKLIMAANFLDCQPMFELICATIACSIFDLTPKQVREKFNIPDDISFEELDAQRKLRIWRQEHPGFPESDPSIIEFEASKKLAAVAADGEKTVKIH